MTPDLLSKPPIAAQLVTPNLFIANQSLSLLGVLTFSRDFWRFPCLHDGPGCNDDLHLDKDFDFIMAFVKTEDAR